MSVIRVALSEWQTISPAPPASLWGAELSPDPRVRQIAARLTKTKRLEVLELAAGIELRASSFVGRIALGQLEITIRPKLEGARLLNLFRYAYGLRDIQAYDHAQHALDLGAFQDFLAVQLAAEVEELVRRGLHRDYEPVTQELTHPRGRIDFARWIASQPRQRATLPCRHFPRLDDTPLNRAVLASVEFAVCVTTDADVRARLRRLSGILECSVTRCRLDDALLDMAHSRLDRRTTAYESALRLGAILLHGEGISFEDTTFVERLPGFLFDMNRFFQALVGRLFQEHLHGWEVLEQFRSRRMFAYDSDRNPQGRRAPAIRPDFVLRRAGRITGVLDAKYRDLWQHALPSSMLYQLAVYALAHPGTEQGSAIVYATTNTGASDQRVMVNAAVGDEIRARVDLRPLNLLRLEEILRWRNESVRRIALAQLATRMAFGSDDELEVAASD